jgi:hypothetical protein
MGDNNTLPGKLSADRAAPFDRLFNDPDVAALAHYWFDLGWASGYKFGIGEGKRVRARQQKGRKGAPKKPGRPQKIDPLMCGLLQEVVDRHVGPGPPVLDLDPDSILAILRNRLKQKE